VIGVSKHLCGGATDLALRCLSAASTSSVGGVLIALCCHHRCTRDTYVANDFLESKEECSFETEDFSLLSGLTSWAVCGSGKPRKAADAKEEDREKDETKEKAGLQDIRSKLYRSYF
jgi:tRNA:m4X modification enzyme